MSRASRAMKAQQKRVAGERKAKAIAAYEERLQTHRELGQELERLAKQAVGLLRDGRFLQMMMVRQGRTDRVAVELFKRSGTRDSGMNWAYAVYLFENGYIGESSSLSSGVDYRRRKLSDEISAWKQEQKNSFSKIFEETVASNQHSIAERKRVISALGSLISDVS